MLSARLHQPIKPSVTWKEDWFSWKPNVCWSFNFMRQYSTNATPFSLNCYRTIINRRKRVFTNQLELTWQKVRTCWSRINQLHFTMYMSNIDITKRKVSPSWRRLTRDNNLKLTWNFYSPWLLLKMQIFPYSEGNSLTFPQPCINLFFPDFPLTGGNHRNWSKLISCGDLYLLL